MFKFYYSSVNYSNTTCGKMGFCDVNNIFSITTKTFPAVNWGKEGYSPYVQYDDNILHKGVYTGTYYVFATEYYNSSNQKFRTLSYMDESETILTTGSILIDGVVPDNLLLYEIEGVCYLCFVVGDTRRYFILTDSILSSLNSSSQLVESFIAPPSVATERYTFSYTNSNYYYSFVMTDTVSGTQTSLPSVYMSSSYTFKSIINKFDRYVLANFNGTIKVFDTVAGTWNNGTYNTGILDCIYDGEYYIYSDGGIYYGTEFPPTTHFSNFNGSIQGKINLLEDGYKCISSMTGDSTNGYYYYNYRFKNFEGDFLNLPNIITNIGYECNRFIKIR